MPFASTGLPLLAALIGTFSLGYLMINLIPLLVGAVMDGLGLGPGPAGRLQTAELMIFAATALLAPGRVVAQPARRLAVTALALAAFAHGLAALAESFPVLLGARLLAGFSQGVLVAIANAVMARTADPDRTYALCFAVMYSGVCVLYAVMPLLTAPFQHLGAYGLLAALCLVIAPLLRALPTGAPGAQEREGVARSRLGARELLYLAGAVAFGVSDGLVWPFAERMGQSIGLAPQSIGRGLGVALLAALPACYVIPGLRLRFGRLGLLLLAVAVNGVAGLVLTTAGGAVVYFGAAWLKTSAILFGIPYLIGTAARLDRTGRLATMTAGLFPLGVSLGPGAAGLVIERQGFAAAGVAALATAGLSCVILAGVLRQGESRER